MKIRSYIKKVVTELVDKFYVHEIRKDPENIYNMVDPSAKVIIALAERAPELMSYVKEDHADKLTDEVKQEIAKNNPDIVLMFPDDKKLTSYVLKNHGDRLSEDAKYSIVAQDPSFIGCIQNPSEKLQTIAVFKDYKCITLIDNPCEFAQRFAVDQDPFVLSLIEPNENICLYAVTKDPRNIKFISEPSDKVLFVATNLSPKCPEIVPSENLTEDVKLSMIKNNLEADKYFLDTSESIQMDNNVVAAQNLDSCEYLTARLHYIFNAGCFETKELKDSRYEQLINENFSSEYKSLQSYKADSNPYKDYPYSLEGCIRLKAGEILENKGILAIGTTEILLTEEGFHVSSIRADNEFKSAVEKSDFVKLSQLKDDGYMPTKNVFESLSLSASSNSVVAVEKIFNINSNTKVEQFPNILSEKDIEKSNTDKMSILL